MDNSSSWDVFVSYSRKDYHIASQLVNDLIDHNLTVWFDDTDIAIGDRIRDSINNGIRNSSIVLIIISINSLKSRWVLNELDAAMIREILEGKTVVYPILIGKVQIDDLPEDIRGKSFIDLRYNFPRKYLREKKKLFSYLSLIANISYSEPTKDEFSVGDEFIEHVINYEFKGDKEINLGDPDTFSRQVGEAIYQTYYIDNYDPKSDDGEFAAQRDQFIDNYGHYGFRKLFLFMLDHMDIGLTTGFTEDQFSELMGSIELTILLFQMQRDFQEQNLDLIIKVRIDTDGEITYRLFQQSGS